jgi:hypothetical protein
VKTALAVSLLTLMAVGCTAAAEQRLLTQFFAASRLRDLTALSNISTVVFEPTVDGIVTSFDITRVSAVDGPDGRPMSKDVSISAPVRLPSGQTVVKAFVLTMQRGMPGSDQGRPGAWMITGIRDGPASASTPRP